MQNMWISVALIVAVIIVGIIAGKRLSTPGPQRRAVYFAFGTLAVLALWFFIFVAFFPAEWIVPFFTVACIVIPICVYMMVLRSGGKERAKAPSKRSFEIPKKDITVESAKAASTVSSGTSSASSATTPSKAVTPAPSASQQTAPASSTPTSAAKTDTSSAPATKAKAPATAAVATAPAKPAASEAPKATAKPSVEASKTSAKEAPKPMQPTAKAEAPSTQKSATESAPVAAPASTNPVEPAKSTEPQKAKPTKPTKQAAKPASHEAASKPFANKEHVAESAIEEATKKTPEPPVKAAPATTSPSEDQLREAAEIEILVDRAAEEEAAKVEELVRPFASQATPAMNAEKERELNVGAPVGSSKEKTPTNNRVDYDTQAVSHYIVMNASTNNAIALPFENAIAVGDTFITVQSYGSFVDANSPASKELVSDANKLVGVEVYSRTGNTLGTVTAFDFDPVFGAIKSITLDNGSEFKSDAFLFFAPDFVFVDDGSKSAADLRQAEDNTSDAPAAAPASTPATQPAPAAQPAAPAANADGLSNEDALLVDFLIGKTLNDDVANADDTFALPKGTEITREIALDAKKHDALLLLTMSVD